MPHGRTGARGLDAIWNMVPGTALMVDVKDPIEEVSNKEPALRIRNDRPQRHACGLVLDQDATRHRSLGTANG